MAPVSSPDLVVAPRRESRFLGEQGTTEAEWQACEALQNAPLVSLDELVPPGRRALIVAPHPDDEVLATGGLLALLARVARPVQVLAVTEGEASHPGSSRYPRPTLPQLRRAESSAGLRQLGVLQPSVQLGFADGRVQHAADALRRALFRYIVPTDVVLTTFALDGHPDHEACAAAAAAVCADRGATLVECPVWLWHWARPDSPSIPWSRAVRLPLDAQSLRRKRAALHAHRSQLEADPSTGRGPVLGAAQRAHHLRPWETFFR